jgi:hypothetical protein
MPAVDARERIERQLREAIDRLRADLALVEIWASALDGFSRPIPDYEPTDHVTRHLLPDHHEGGAAAQRREPFGPAEPAHQRREH